MRALGYVHLSDGVVSSGDARGAINVAAERRGWTLVGVVEDADGSALPEARARMDRGEAEVLVVVPRLPRTGEQDHPALKAFDWGRAGGWRVVLPTAGVEQGRPSGDSFERAQRDGRIAPRLPPGVPLAPVTLRERSAGTTDPLRYEQSSHWSLELVAAAAERHGRPLEGVRTLLDFGCGAGRVLRRLRAERPEIAVTGADTDAEAVAWVAEAFPDVATAVLGEFPPAPLPDAAFELVIGLSVFTHLDEAHQDAWLAELARVVAPGGLVLLTFQGARSAEWHRDHPLVDLGGALDRFDEEGFAFWREDGWERAFPDWYHTTFHTEAYVRRHWSRWFEVLEIKDFGEDSHQDLAVLRAGGSSSR